MKLTKNQEYALMAAGAVLALIFIFYQFLLKPLNADIVSLGAKLEQKQKDLAAAKQMAAKYDEFKKRSDAVLRELQWAQSRMPAPIDKTQFVESINALQSISGVTLTDFQSEPAAKSENKSAAYTEALVNIQLKSSFAQFMKFLYEVSISKNLMVVRNVEVTSAENNLEPNSDRTLSAQMVLSGIQGKKP